MAKRIAEVVDVEVDRVWNARRMAQGFASIDEATRGAGILVLLSERDGGPRLFQSDNDARLALGIELVLDALRNDTIQPSDLIRYLHQSDQHAPGVPKYLYPSPAPVDKLVDLHTYSDAVQGLVTSAKLRDGTEIRFDAASIRDFTNAIERWLRTDRGSRS